MSVDPEIFAKVKEALIDALGVDDDEVTAVSYTHLTLPTICSV